MHLGVFVYESSNQIYTKTGKGNSYLAIPTLQNL
jgi:hypothetical protein